MRNLIAFILGILLSACQTKQNKLSQNIAPLSLIAQEISQNQLTKVNTPFFARILRGTKDSDFSFLSPNPDRKIVLLIDKEGVLWLFHKNSRKSILSRLGYTSEEIKKMKKENVKFKLLIFQTEKSLPQIATWENLSLFLEKAYPHNPTISLLFKKFSTQLKTQTISAIDFKQIKHTDLNLNSSFLTFRSFLFTELHLNERFTGTGYIESTSSPSTHKEYFYVNSLIDSSHFLAWELIDIPAEHL